MPKTKISEYSTTNADNTDIEGINIAENCPPSGINNAIRELMVHLKEWQSGAADTYNTPAGTVSAPAIAPTGDSNTGIFFPAADTIAFAEGGAEAMRIDSSGNVLIGTTSASGFDSAADNLIVGGGSGSTGMTIYSGTAGVGSINFADGTTGSAIYAGGINYNHSTNLLALYTNDGSTRMAIDSSGNVGIGVTPSAWGTGSSRKAIQFPGGGSVWGQNFAGNNPSIQLACNTYEATGGATYVQTAHASQYTQNAGDHTFQSAASGTAGNPITFTSVLSVNRNTTLVLQGGTSTSGTGIAFPATQSASSDANTLDDYEEGDWTPTWVVANGTITANSSNTAGKYVKIGKVVYVSGFISYGSNSSASGKIQIGGLPFQPAKIGYPAADFGSPITIGYNYGWTGNSPRGGYFVAATTKIDLLYSTTATGTLNSTNQFSDMWASDNYSQIHFSGFYYIS